MASRVAVRSFGRLESILVLLFMIAAVTFFTARFAKAETTKHKRTTTTTTVESDGEDADDAPAAPTGFAPPANAVAAPDNMPAPSKLYTEAEMSQTFGVKAASGLAGCKTEELSKGVIKDLKQQCSKWVSEQKKDLGKKYLGNTCEDSCDDCEMSLIRCKVTGTIRYKKQYADD